MRRNRRYLQKAGYIIKIFVAFLLAFPQRKKLMDSEIWLIGFIYDKYENVCRELYEYLVTQGKNVYWVVGKEKSGELSRHVPKDKILYRASIRDYVMGMYAKVGAYAGSDADIAPGLYRILGRKTCVVNLCHGHDSIKDISAGYYSSIPADLIICASEQEKLIKTEKFGARADQCVVTGYAWYDSLDVRPTRDVRKIMIMPTWRDWYISEKIPFQKSGIFLAYRSLLKRLADLINAGVDIEVDFLLHPSMALYFGEGTSYDFPGVNYVTDTSGTNQYLRSTDMLITDYSAISFDCIYMNKPVIFYWFDYEEYRKRHGLIVDKDAFENICFTEDEVMEKLSAILSGRALNCEDREKYFDYFDKNNCERIFRAIEKRYKF